MKSVKKYFKSDFILIVILPLKYIIYLESSMQMWRLSKYLLILKYHHLS